MKLDVPTFLVVSTTLGLFAILGLLVFHGVPDQSKDLINIMIGWVGAAWTGIVTYHFGSSSGSAAKTELLVRAQDNHDRKGDDPTP